MARPFIAWDTTRPGFGRADYAAADRMCRTTTGPKNAQRHVWSSVERYMRLLQDGYRVSGGVGWVAPIGVPTPSWGVLGNPIDAVDPGRPAQWPSTEVAGHYYVNYQTGTDTGRTYGTPNAPRQTVPSSPSAGSRIEMAAVSYNAQINFAGTGTAAAPIWVVGAGASTPAVIRQDAGTSGAYYILRYLKSLYNGSTTASFDFNGNHICARDCEYQSIPLTQGSNSSATGVAGTNIVLYNCNTHDNGPTDPSSDLDIHGCGLGVCNNVWFMDSVFHHNCGDGIQMHYNGTKSECHHIYVGRSTSYTNRQTGFWGKFCQDVIFSQNICYGQAGTNTGGPGAGIGAQYDHTRIWVLANKFYTTSNRGVHFASTDDVAGNAVYVLGNLIYNVRPSADTAYDNGDVWNVDGAAVSVMGSGCAVYVMNNTIYDCYGGINVRDGQWFISDNIIHLTQAPGGGSTHILTQNAISGSEAKRNICYGATFRADINSSVYTTAASFNNGSTRVGNTSTDPNLTNPAAYNFIPAVGSNAIDTGVEGSPYATFQTLYGIDIRKDFGGGTRPFGAQWDIGAYEYGATAGTPPTGTPILSVR